MTEKQLFPSQHDIRTASISLRWDNGINIVDLEEEWQEVKETMDNHLAMKKEGKRK